MPCSNTNIHSAESTMALLTRYSHFTTYFHLSSYCLSLQCPSFVNTKELFHEQFSLSCKHFCVAEQTTCTNKDPENTEVLWILFLKEGQGAQTFLTFGWRMVVLLSFLSALWGNCDEWSLVWARYPPPHIHPQQANKQTGRKTHRGSCSLKFGWTKERKFKHGQDGFFFSP